MGDFLIKVAAQGGHGCQREAKAGEVFQGCGQAGCVDCWWQMKVLEFKHQFPGQLHYATFTHWPVELNKTMGRNYDEAHEVVDDISHQSKEGWMTVRGRKRIKGSFGK